MQTIGHDSWGIVGHHWAVDMLRHAVAAQRPAHAYLISGPRHVGKSLLALRLAQTLNCEQAGDAPCDECRSCRRIAKGNHPDVRIASLATQGATLKAEEAARQRDVRIETVRTWLADINLRPYEGRRRVFILDDVERLSEGAANAITKAENGRYVVNDPGLKAKVLNLRFDPKASASMAAEMTAGHAAYLKGRLGRDANAGELYAAHFLGAAGAGDLAQAVRTQPQANAVSLFPQAAHANPTIFYRDGRAVSVVDLMQNLSRHASGHGVVVNVQDAPKSDEVSGFVHARLENLRAEKMLMELAFGKGSEAATLFSAQLLSAFAPEPESKSSDSF